MSRMKTCIHCGEEKPISDFAMAAKTAGRTNRCHLCVTNQRMRRQSGNVEIYLGDLYTKNKSARAKKFEWKITAEDIISLWEEQNGRCAISGLYMTHHVDRGERKDFNASIDRIRSTEGYVRDNIQLVCQRVNTIKNDLDEASLYWWVKHIYDFSCD